MYLVRQIFAMTRPPLAQRQMTEREWSVIITNMQLLIAYIYYITILCIYHHCFCTLKLQLWGHLYLADHVSTDRRSTCHVDLVFQDCTIHIVNFAVILNIRIYVYVFVCFVFVIQYDIQVHFHVTGQINIRSSTSVIDRYCGE